MGNFHQWRHIRMQSSGFTDEIIRWDLLLFFKRVILPVYFFKNLLLRWSLCLCVVVRLVVKTFIFLIAAERFTSCRLMPSCASSGWHDWRGPIGAPQRTPWFVPTTLQRTALWNGQFQDFLLVGDWSRVLFPLYFQLSRWKTVTFAIGRYLLTSTAGQGMFYNGYGYKPNAGVA